ncbi:MAG: PEGA domain-containing protein [Epulopiscium sp.]|nr:PEGA domain-containing protein [Candidatus Epulonipiscium sp.]
MNRNKNRSRKNKNSASEQLNIIKKILWIGGIGLIVMILSTLLVSYIITKDKENPSLERKKPSVMEDKTKQTEKKVFGVIHHISDEDQLIELYDIEEEKKVYLVVDITTEMKDQYGQAMTLSQFRVGDIIQVKYIQEKDKNKSKYIRISAETWNNPNINNVKLDQEQKNIQVGNHYYHYTDALVTRYKNQPFDLASLDLIDEVTIKGYGDQVLTIILEKSHGYVTVQDYDQYTEGTLEIGTNILVPLQEANEVPIPEGIHKVVINREAKQPFTSQIMVEAGKTVVINPGETPAKIGTLELQVNAKDYKLFIDEIEQSNSTKSVELDYGEHTILIQKTDYEDWTSTIEIKQPYTRIKIDLIQKAKFIHIQTNPSGAEVYVDDNYVGYSPISTPLEIGEHKILIRKEGFESKEHKINIREDNQDVYYTFPPLEPQKESSIESMNKDTIDNKSTTEETLAE